MTKSMVSGGHLGIGKYGVPLTAILHALEKIFCSGLHLCQISCLQTNLHNSLHSVHNVRAMGHDQWQSGNIVDYYQTCIMQFTHSVLLVCEFLYR